MLTLTPDDDDAITVVAALSVLTLLPQYLKWRSDPPKQDEKLKLTNYGITLVSMAKMTILYLSGSSIFAASANSERFRAVPHSAVTE